MSVSADDYLANVNRLIRTLEISNAELARGLNYDPSQISRFLSGERMPSDTEKFNRQLAYFIASHYSSPANISALMHLFSCEKEELDSPARTCRTITRWLGSNSAPLPDRPLDSFLSRLDTFDLNDFISAIHFNDIKIPSLPFTLPSTNYYHGIEEFKQSEFDFIKAAALSRSREDMIIYSDMPIAEMAKDEVFAKKYMFGLAILLKKGLHLHFIHDVHRPFNEILVGLEGHIPMYMTGQISPYYFAEPQNRIFCHLLKVSGTAAMCGFGLSGDHEDGLYLVTKNKADVQHYKKSARAMLRSAKPLMDIFRSDREELLMNKLRKLWISGSQRMILSGLPLFTLSDELLYDILRRSEISEEDCRRAVDFKHTYTQSMEETLKNYSLTIEIAALSQEQFSRSPVSLDLSPLFLEREVFCTYEEYSDHLKSTFSFAERFGNCIVKTETERTFKNISFTIVEGNCVVVSKARNPAIHFIIHHPKIVKAFEMFVPPFRDIDVGP